MARRIAVIGASGGVGCTSLVLNLAIVLARSGRRTAVLDLAPQGGVGAVLAYPDGRFPGISDCLSGLVEPSTALCQSSTLKGLSLMFRGRLDPRDEAHYEAALAGGEALEGLLDELGKQHELLLLDTPTGFGAITQAALRSADRVLVMAEPTPLGLRAVARTMRMIRHVCEHENTELKLVGVVASKVMSSLRVHREGMSVLRAKLPEFLPLHFPYSEACLQSTRVGRPVALPPTEAPDYMVPLEGLSASIIRDEFVAHMKPKPKALEAAGYQRFTSADREVAGSSSEVEAAPCEGGLDLSFTGSEGSFGAGDWESFLESCMRATEAIGAFVLDGSGLAVADLGQLPSGASTELGGRLVVALEQASKMAADVSRISVELEQHCLVGFGATFNEDQHFVLGLLCPEQVPSDMSAEIAKAFQGVLDCPFGSALS